MKKNLKKVISAVIALALSVSSTAFAATSFSDVADTASYAQAVNTLAALGVISGYEDGTFLPENNITRAEVATMVVAALNRSADAEGAKGTTKFADVNTEAKAWASGFVNIGVSEGFISGYEDGTFKPDNNVTYAEMVSMLVRVAGYGRYAEYLGGWPNGYLSVGNDKGVTKGVSAGADTAVTRAQVAQMIYNTLLEVPVVESTTLTTDSNGNLVPEMTIMDGKGDNEYKTMLTEKHDAYYVEGHVSATNRTNSAKFDADEVEFTIEYTENYDDSDVVIKKGAKDSSGDPITSKEPVYVGETDAKDYLFTYASAIIKIDDNDDATLVSFIPSGRNDVKSFDTNLIDDDSYKADEDYKKDDGTIVDQTTVFDATGKVLAKPYVKYYDSKSASKSQKYNLDKNFELYVNGVEVTANKANFEKYVLNNEVGKVDYIDRYSAASKADGYYDLIFVTYYATAKVGAVNLSSGKVTFDNAYNNNGVNYVTLDPEDDDLVYDIIYNGENIELSAIQVDDILSIAYDVDQGLDNSDFFEILVSRDTAEGKYTGKNADDEVVTIGGKQYEFVMGYSEADELTMSDEYTLYLDAFGRIFDYETSVSSAKLAIVDKFTKASSDDYYRALLYTTDGSAKNLEVDTTKVTNLTNDEIKAKVYNDPADTTKGKKSVENRVVKYKISSSSGRIISLEFVSGNGVTDQAYKANSKSLGSIKMNDATKVIDAIDYQDPTNKTPTYSDLSISSVAGFVDDGEYTAFAFGDKNSDGTYPLVIVTSAGGNYTYETNIAVLTKTPSPSVEDETGDDIYTVEALYQGEEVALVANDDVLIKYGKKQKVVDDVPQVDGEGNPVMVDNILNYSDLNKGDVIVFVKDGKGNIKTIDVLLSAAAIGVDTDYAKVASNAFKDGGIVPTLPEDANNWTDTWTVNEDPAYNNGTGINQGKEVTRLVYGPVVGKKSNYFTLGSIAEATNVSVDDGTEAGTKYSGLYTNIADENGTGGAIDIDLTDSTKVYVFDYSKTNTRTQLYAGTRADIMAATIAKSLTYNNGDFIPWNNTGVKDGANFAFAKVVDGTATDVFVILSK